MNYALILNRQLDVIENLHHDQPTQTAIAQARQLIDDLFSGDPAESVLYEHFEHQPEPD